MMSDHNHSAYLAQASNYCGSSCLVAVINNFGAPQDAKMQLLAVQSTLEPPTAGQRIIEATELCCDTLVLDPQRFLDLRKICLDDFLFGMSELMLILDERLQQAHDHQWNDEQGNEVH